MNWRGSWLTRRFELTFIKAFVVAFLIVIATAVITWFTVDRSQFLRATCEAGFPNLTLLSLSDDGKLGCTVFEEKQRVSGVVESVDGSLFFYAPNLADRDDEEGRMLFECLRAGCEKALLPQFEKTFVTSCVDEIGSVGLAGVILEGWLAEEAFEFGHSRRARSRVMVIGRVIEVFDPGSSRIDDWRQVFDQVCEDQ